MVKISIFTGLPCTLFIGGHDRFFLAGVGGWGVYANVSTPPINLFHSMI